MMGLRVSITDFCPSVFAIVFFASPIRRLTRLIRDRVYTVSSFFASLRGTPRDSPAQPRDSQVQIQRKVLSACHDVRRSVLLVLKDMRMENIISQQLTASGDVLYGTSPLGANAIQHDVAIIARLLRSFVRGHHGLSDLIAHLIEATRRRSRQHHRLRVLRRGKITHGIEILVEQHHIVHVVHIHTDSL